jgi:hypothetical protein
MGVEDLLSTTGAKVGTMVGVFAVSLLKNKFTDGIICH